MPPHKAPPLVGLMPQGYIGGLRFKTVGREEYDDETGMVRVTYRFLLKFPGNNAIARVMWRRLKKENASNLTKEEVNHALARVYHHAADNVDYCWNMEPAKFFGAAASAWNWSSYIEPEDFWRLTYRLFYARRLFIEHEQQYNDDISSRSPLVQALDRFQAAFDAEFHQNAPVETASNQEDIERIEDELYLRRCVYEKIFPEPAVYFGNEDDFDIEVDYKRLPGNNNDEDIDMGGQGAAGSASEAEGVSWGIDLGPNKHKDGYEGNAFDMREVKAALLEARVHGRGNDGGDDEDDDVEMDIDE
ncbi:hypothetical protein F4778DRAFT_349735 [Xylariomycetidae sp. FL2044]|nr:hypothetical protein F4778DRAFT_349735 [Xylariomycetidae sp. FL2044]